MKEITERLRAAMNLVLVATLLLAWGGFQRPLELTRSVGHIRELINAYRTATVDSLESQVLSTFSVQIGDTLNGRHPTKEDLSHLRISTLEEISDEVRKGNISIERSTALFGLIGDNLFSLASRAPLIMPTHRVDKPINFDSNEYKSQIEEFEQVFIERPTGIMTCSLNNFMTA